MKLLLIPFLLLFSISLMAQADTLNSRQVDSLLRISRGMAKKGEFEAAFKQCDVAEKLAIDKLGKESVAYSNCLVYKAWIFSRMGNYPMAEKFYLETEILRRKLLGTDHIEYGRVQNSLGVLYWNMGQYEKAEIHHLEANRIIKLNLGTENNDYAGSLNNLANLYSDMGQNEKAEKYYVQAIGIHKNLLGDQHPYYAESLENLSILYEDMGQLQKAEPLYLEANKIWEKVYGREDPSFAGSLNNLGVLYKNMGQLDKAEEYHAEAKNIREKLFGKNHSDYAQSINNLALVFYEKALYKEAEELFLESKNIREKLLGKEHYSYSLCLFNLSNVYLDTREFEKAAVCFDELSKLNRNAILKGVRHLSESELSNYIDYFSSNQNRMLSFASVSGHGLAIENCFNSALFHKGFILNVSSQLRKYSYSDPVVSGKLENLKQVSRDLAKEYSQPVDKRDLVKISLLESRSDSLEKNLAKSVAGYGDLVRPVRWQDVQAALGPAEAAIEFVRFRFYRKAQTDTILYAALVLLPGSPRPEFVALFDERSLDSLIASNRERKADYVNQLYSISDRGAQILENSKRGLYDLIWKPLESKLSGTRKIYYSPAGLLHRLNLGAMAINADETLADRYTLVELNSTRRLLLQGANQYVENSAVVLGGLKYDRDTLIPDSEGLIASRSRDTNSSGNDLKASSWEYLPGTEREARSLKGILEQAGFAVVSKTGWEGTEENFKRLGVQSPSPRLLHIATHGYFFSDRTEALAVANVAGLSVFETSDQPMVRSGLILAEGNVGWRGDRSREGREDGVLTAFEISQMNLSNTELVVLSACETGLGDIQGNEGVYGLQRAFKIAGAKYLIMSLWQVPDKQTSMLMTTFYKKWLEQKMTIPDAFHAAQKELRDMGFDPYQWAGFVLVE